MGSFAEDFTFDFVSQFLKISFKDNGLGRSLAHGSEKVKMAAWLAAQSMAPQVENYAKINAPWTDQTGNARNGLAARPYRSGDEIGIIVYHQVDYGIFLETLYSGKFAIINPTIEHMTPIVMATYNRMLERITWK